jgi:hypothetical protein
MSPHCGHIIQTEDRNMSSKSGHKTQNYDRNYFPSSGYIIEKSDNWFPSERSQDAEGQQKNVSSEWSQYRE